MSVFIHPTADVSPDATVGDGTRIWHGSHVREGAVIGRGCVIGEHVLVDHHVRLGDHCKVQNAALLYHGVTLEDGVFVGPRVCFTNDRYPRAIDADGRLLGADDWVVSHTLVRRGASVGAGAVVVAGITVGRFATVGAGAVVTASVPDHALVVGVPARRVGWVCACGRPLPGGDPAAQPPSCPRCGRTPVIPPGA